MGINDVCHGNSPINLKINTAGIDPSVLSYSAIVMQKFMQIIKEARLQTRRELPPIVHVL